MAEAVAFLAIATVCSAAVIDVIRYEIPDAASLVTLVSVVIFGSLTPGFVWWSHGAAAVAMFAFGLLAFSRGWLGGGDVKLMTSIAAWAGIADLPLLFIAISVAGGGLTLVFVVRRRIVGQAPAVTHVPYAVAIAIGTVWWLVATGGGPLAARHANGDQRSVARAIAT